MFVQSPDFLIQLILILLGGKHLHVHKKGNTNIQRFILARNTGTWFPLIKPLTFMNFETHTK